MNTKNPLQSRWGFHPCDNQTFEKLKVLHKHYWQTLYAFHRWHRWWRKLPENRPGPEPPVCPLFVIDQPWCKSVTTHGVAGFKLYPRTVVDHEVVALFQTARRPTAEPVEPWEVATTARIEELHAQLLELLKEPAVQ
jgi:hypothetical protein